MTLTLPLPLPWKFDNPCYHTDQSADTQVVDTKNCQNDTVKGQKAFLIASIGQAKNLENFLKPMSEIQRKTILEKPYLDEENDQFCPPLVIAARNGHFEVVKTLINKVRT